MKSRENYPLNVSEAKHLREEIESCFYLVKDNVSSLLERGGFSFQLLDTRMGKLTGDTLNKAIRSRIKSLEKEECIGTIQIYKETLRLLNEFAGMFIFKQTKRHG